MKQQYDYLKCTMEFVAERKHIFSNLKYYGAVFTDLIILSAKLHDQNPKYVVPISLTTSIGWSIDKKDNQIILKSFIIKYFDKLKEFHCSDDQLQKLKVVLRNKVTFYKIADFYEAQYNLGKGSSAKVIQIRQLFGDNAKFAAKAIDKAYLLRSEQGMEAFCSEVAIMNHLTNVIDAPFIKLYDTFEGDHTYYLIMDLMSGKSLAEELEHQKQRKELFPMKVVRLIMHQLLVGVQAMHEANVIHRDLKPDNIMFRNPDSFEQLIIVDFGLATFTDVPKYAFPKCGTPGYVAPEILNIIDRDSKYDRICDIFSCGCIFFKLQHNMQHRLVGYSLFPGNTFNEVLKTNKICQFSLDIPDLQHCPKDALDLLTRMLEKNPYNRITAKQALQSPFFNVDESPIHIKKHLDLKIETKNMFQIQQLEDTDELASPFQRQAVKKCTYVDDDDITENKETTIIVRQMPSVKKPTFVPMSEENSVHSFYAKDPLSSFKKIKRDSNDPEFGHKLYGQETKHQMQQISLFNKFRQSENEY